MYRPLDELLKLMTPKPVAPLIVSRQLQLKTINDTVAFTCNRGITVQRLDNFICLCPPAYYGLNCEFHSDRLTFIIQLDQIRTTTICLVALLLFNDQIIDEVDFHIYPSTTSQKHRFH
jgi:hypothetical protein